MTALSDRGRLLPALALAAAGLSLAAVLVAHLPRLRQATAGIAAGSALPGATTPAARAATDYSALPGLNLLGAAPAAAAPAPPAPAAATTGTLDPSALPTANVRFTLRGVAYTEDEQRARAIIATAEGLQKRFAVGETPEPGVTIERITPREIVVRHAGRLERVALPTAQTGAGGAMPLPPGAMPEPQAPESVLPEAPPVPPETMPPVLPQAPPES